jgi:hypothetical protein
MKKLFVGGLVALALTGCGYVSTDNELMGQVKKVKHNTPLICPNYYSVDVSLGVMRNGVGSMSTQDVWLRVEDHSMLKTLREATESGALVKIKCDQYRFAPCAPDYTLTGVEIIP